MRSRSAWVTVLIAALALMALVDWWLAESPAFQINVPKGVEVEVVLTPDLVAELGGSLGTDFEVTQSGSLVLQAGNSIVELRLLDQDDVTKAQQVLKEKGHDPGTIDGIMGRRTQEALIAFQTSHDLHGSGRLDPETRARLGLDRFEAVRLGEAEGVRAFTVDTNGVPWIISSRGLAHLIDGGLHHVMSLPDDAAETRIALSVTQEILYLYGGNDEDKGFTRKIVAVSNEGRVTHLVAVPEPVKAVTELSGTLYFATPNAIYTIEDSEIRLLIRVSDETKIASLAVGHEAVYFSTADRVYALKGLVAVSVAINMGGTLRVRDGSLFVLDPRRNFLVRLGNLQSL